MTDLVFATRLGQKERRGKPKVHPTSSANGRPHEDEGEPEKEKRSRKAGLSPVAQRQLSRAIWGE